MKVKRIFITGIAGFIGFHLARALKKRKDEVVGCDDFNSYYDPRLKRARAQILKEEKIEIIESDINDQTRLQKLFVDHQITHLVHLAAQAGVRYSLTHPESYTHSNLQGCVRIMELCRQFPEVKCVFASSSSVYGLNQKIPFSEMDRTDHPANLYAATKKSGEMIAHAYHHLYHIPITILRFFTVYGPWGRPDMAYFSFTKNILNEEPIKVFYQGKMKRDFTYISDVVEGIIAATDLGSEFEIFNLGNNHPEEVNTLISLIEEKTKKKANREQLPLQQGEVLETYADISKSQTLLGFKPKVSLKEGLDYFLEWYLSDELPFLKKGGV